MKRSLPGHTSTMDCAETEVLGVYRLFLARTGHVCEPTEFILSFSFDDLEVSCLDSLSDRPSTPAADGDAIYGSDRRHFRRCTRKENFVCNVQHLPGDDRFDH